MVALIRRMVWVLCLAVGAVSVVYGLTAADHGAITGGVVLLATGASILVGVSRALGRTTGHAVARSRSRTSDERDA